MTDRSSGPEHPRPDEVRRSLRALADGSAPPRVSKGDTTARDPSSPRPESVVADAERAVRCARGAASFLSAGRLPGLDRAIATAARRGDDDVVARGRAARESLRRLDAALNGGGSAETLGGTDPTVGPQSHDHFRSGRGTVLGDTAQGSDR